MPTDDTPTAQHQTAADAVRAVTHRLRRGYERQDAVGMGELYADDATWELHVGDSLILLQGRPAIVGRYAQDLHSPPTLRRWDVRPAPWGAVVEAEAEQGTGDGVVRFRWVHLLAIKHGRITGDVVYCSGAVPAAAPA